MIRVIGKLADLSGRGDARPIVRGLPSRYRIERELGRGGMAIVYLARDKQLDRDVAIKVLHATLSADKSSVARLSHEARLVAQVQHPNIVAIYDLEGLRDKSVALIMQYVRGRTLRAIIDQDGRLAVPLVERILAQIAGALSAAHKRGIIHRDVKPENIYLDQESGRALLADFGIAQAPRIQSGLTLAGESVGTPYYMSPEQIAGGDVDGRSDLYSLGLVGYEMLTGEQPWSGDSLYNVLHKQQHQYLPSLARRRPDTPASLQRAIEQSLRKDRSERPRSAEVFLKLLGTTAVAAAMEGSDSPPAEERTPSSREASPTAPTVRYVRRRRGNQAAPEEQIASNGEVIPIQLFPWEGTPHNGEAEQTAATTPLPAAAVSNPTFAGIKTGRFDLSQGEENSGKGPRKPSRWRSAVGLVAASVSAACIVAILGFFFMASGPPAQAESVTASPPIAQTPQEQETPQDASLGSNGGSSAPAPAPTPRGSGSYRSRPASEEYDSRGDLTDVVCRPLGDETVEEWADRVPAYCQR